MQTRYEAYQAEVAVNQQLTAERDGWAQKLAKAQGQLSQLQAALGKYSDSRKRLEADLAAERAEVLKQLEPFGRRIEAISSPEVSGRAQIWCSA
jgi:Skp family chaperone for outer membrane proteins